MMAAMLFPPGAVRFPARLRHAWARTLGALLSLAPALWSSSCCKGKDPPRTVPLGTRGGAAVHEGPASRSELPRTAPRRRPPSCPSVQHSVRLSLVEGGIDGEFEPRGSLEVAPAHQDLDPEWAAVIGARADLNRDGEEDLLLYLDMNPGSSLDLPWFAVVACKGAPYWLVLAPIWVRRVQITSSGSDPGWLDLEVIEASDSEGFEHLELYGYRDGAYSRVERPPPDCPDGIDGRNAARLHPSAKGGPDRQVYFFVPHPVGFRAAAILGQPDLNGDNAPDLLVDFTGDCTICPKGAYVSCGNDWYAPVLSPSREHAWSGLETGRQTAQGWLELTGTLELGPASGGRRSDILQFDGREYWCATGQRCGAASD